MPFFSANNLQCEFSAQFFSPLGEIKLRLSSKSKQLFHSDYLPNQTFHFQDSCAISYLANRICTFKHVYLDYFYYVSTEDSITLLYYTQLSSWTPTNVKVAIFSLLISIYFSSNGELWKEIIFLVTLIFSFFAPFTLKIGVFFCFVFSSEVFY